MAEPKVILAYGDSLTYGSNPVPDGARHPHEDRWPTALELGLGGAARVIAEGLGGRTTVHDDYFADADRNGARLLPTILSSHEPLDMVIIMLGTNDLKPYLGRTAMEAANGVGRLIQITRAHFLGQDEAAPKIIIVAPPHLCATDHPEMMVHFGEDAAIAESKRMGGFYKLRAELYQVDFFDASTVAQPSPHDGVHLDAVNTRAIGEGLVPLVKQVLGL
jgi:lysophospholipase L1-like esterase